MPIDRWPLIGRSDELRVIHDDLRRGRSGIVISGAPGVGKTRLASDASAAARAAGHPLRWATATRSVRRVPLGALAQLLPVPVLEHRDPALRRRVAEALVDEEAERPTVLVVDDVHLLDDTSAAVLHDLASDPRCFLVLAQRADARPPDAVAQLWKDGIVRRLDLQPIGRPEVQAVLERVLGGSVLERTTLVLWEATRGNVLYLRELVEEGLRRRVLTRSAQGWAWQGSLVLSASLRELIADRIGRRSPAERAVLETVALSEPIELEALELLCDPDAVTALERDGLVVVQSVGRRWMVSLNHPLYVEAVRAQTPESAARRTRLALANWLEARALHRGEDILRLAGLHAEAGGGSVGLFVDAARRAWALGAHADAEAHARSAMAHGDHEEAVLLLGHALADTGRFDDAIREWATIEPSTEELRTEVALARANTLAYALGRTSEGLRVLADAAEHVSEGPAAALVSVAEASLRAIERVPAGDEQATLVDLTVSSDAETATRAALAWSTAALLEGRPLTVMPRLTGSAALAARCREHFPTGGMWLRLCELYAHLLAGDLDGAEALAVREGAEPGAAASERALWCEVTGLLLLERGRPRDAIPHFDETAAYRVASDDGGWSANRLHVAAAWAAAGAPRQAEAALEEARVARPSAIMSLYPEPRARAAVLRSRGDLAEAHELSIAAAIEQRDAGRVVIASLLLHDAMRHGATDVAADLAVLASGTEGLIAALGEHADAVMREDEEAQRDVARRLADWGFAALAADVDPRARPPGTAVGVALTARERQVADLAAAGMADRAIAEHLFVSVRTVHAHLRATYAKLGVAGRHELRR